MKRQISMGTKPSTIAEEAVDQLQENEKLVAGLYSYIYILPNNKICVIGMKSVSYCVYTMIVFFL